MRTWKRKDGSTGESTLYRVRVGWTRDNPATGGVTTSTVELGEYSTLSNAKAALEIARSEITKGTFVSPQQLRRQAKADAVRAQALAVAHRVTVSIWAAEWLELLETSGRTTSTITSYKSVLRAHVLPHIGELPLAAVTEADIAATLKAASAKSASAERNTIRTLSAMFNSALEHEAGGLEASPVKVRAAKSRERSDAEIPDASEVQRLILAAPPEIQLALVLAAKLGLRFGELLGLQRGDFANIDKPDGATLTVARQWLSKGSKLAPTKGKLARTLPVPNDLAKIVERHLAEYALAGPAAFVFPGVTHKDQCMKPRAFADRLKVARDASGCDYTLHALRHFAVTNFNVSGAGVADAGALAGHKNVAVTERYLHSHIDRQRAIVEAGPALEVAPTTA